MSEAGDDIVGRYGHDWRLAASTSLAFGSADEFSVVALLAMMLPALIIKVQV